jgi:hypothetical protein
MPVEHVGDPLEIYPADHPPRSDSARYAHSRKTLMTEYGGGCFICDGPIDLSMNILMPDMYGGVIDEPMTWYMLGGTLVWLIIGNAMMFKMSNFRF